MGIENVGEREQREREGRGERGKPKVRKGYEKAKSLLADSSFRSLARSPRENPSLPPSLSPLLFIPRGLSLSQQLDADLAFFLPSQTDGRSDGQTAHRSQKMFPLSISGQPHEAQVQGAHVLQSHVLRPLRIAALRTHPPGPQMRRYSS